MHGDIGYKFCSLLLSEDQTQGTPIGNEIKWRHCREPLRGHESTDTAIGNESNGAVAGEGSNFTVI